MSIIETYYLVDFENVNEAGLFCSKDLGSHDHIHIFSTENAPKISIETLSAFNSTEHISHIVPAGKQSLDMHLVSYLGYLLGKNGNKKCKYIIVSKDTDYDNVISFFKSLNPSDIMRQVRIDSTSKRNTVQNSAATKTTNTNSTNAAMATPQNKSQLNTKIQRAISDAGYSKTVSNHVASIVVKRYGEDKFANYVHNELRENYSDYSDIYKIVKPIIAECSSTCSKANTTSQHNNDIQNILRKANFTGDIISYVVSLCSKHYNEKNDKQTIYRTIVAKYGQKQGLNIYNHIKKSL